MNKTFCLLLLCFLCIVEGAAQDKVSFFSEMDTVFQQIHVGREVQLCYLSNRKIEKHTLPVWNTEEVERISGPHPTTSSRVETINGVSEVVSLQGVYYAIRFLKSGTFTLPAITAVIEGNTYTCDPAVVRVLPAESSEGVVCTLAVKPETPKVGQEFEVILTCNRKPDASVPTFHHPDIEQVSFSGNSTSRNGVGEYRYVYKMKAARPGNYILVPLDLTFGGTEYPLKTYQFDVERVDYLWGFVFFFLGIGAIIRFWLFFHREGKYGLAEFVMTTGRLNLSVGNALTHYGLSVFAFILPFTFVCCTIYDYFLRTPPFYTFSFVVGMIGIPVLLCILFACMQYRKLFFEKVETKLSIDELYEVIQKVGAQHEWSCEYAGDDCFVGHTSPGFFSGSWDEQIFVVFDKGQVWINSICDLNQRASITSFGRTKKNIRLLKKAIAEAEGRV